MPQVNVEFDDESHRKLERLTGKYGRTRPQLVRRAVEEMIAADADGRQIFRPGDREVRPDEVAFLLRELGSLKDQNEALASELARMLAQARKTQAEYEKLRTVQEAKDQNQQAGLLERVLAPLKVLLENFAVSMKAAWESNPRFDKIDDRLASIAAALEINNKLAAQPRTLNRVQVATSDLQVRTWIFALLMCWAVGVVAFLAIAKTIEPIGHPIGVGLLGGDSAAPCNAMRQAQDVVACASERKGKALVVVGELPVRQEERGR